MLDLTGPLPARRPRPAGPPARRPGRRSRPPRLIPPDEDEPADVFAAIRAGDILVHHPYECFAASRRAVHRPGRRRPRRPDDQADPLPDVAATRRSSSRPDPGRRAGQAGRRPGRDQGPLRRGGQHRLGAQAGAGRRPRRLRAGRPQDPLQDRARRPPRGLRPAPLRPHRDRQLQPEDRAAVRRPGPADLPAGDRRGRHRPVQRPDRPVAPARRSGGCSSRRTACASRFLELDRARDRRTPRPGRPARIVLKLNAIVDPACIEALYRAQRRPASTSTSSSAASARSSPGCRASRSDIRVRSIIGEFLEHSRIWRLRERRRPRVVHRLGRPDGPQPGPAGRGARAGRGRRRPRPDRRDPRRSMLADDRRSWQLGSDATLASGPRTLERRGRARIDTFETLKELALASGARLADAPHRPRLGRRLARPARLMAMTDPLGRTRSRSSSSTASLDLAAGERFLAADALGPFAGRVGSRAAQHEDRYLDTADGALARAGYAVRLRHTRGGHHRHREVARPIASDGALRPARGARGPGRPGRRSRSTGRLRRPLAHPRAVRRRAAGRARHRAPAPPEAPAQATDATVELSLDEVDVVARGRVDRPLRGARGRADRASRPAWWSSARSSRPMRA